jgi:undecaprenyl-diphosphatase
MSKSKSSLPVKGKTLFYWLLGIVIVVAAIVTAFYFDAAVAQFMVDHQTPVMRSFMRNVSRFGDWWSHFLVGLACAGIAWRRGNKKWTRIFLAMLIALSIAGIAGRVIKVSTGRARPSVKIEQGWNGPRLSSKYHAFPSGHVVASTAFFAVLAFANWRIGVPCFAITILIAISRLYGGAHYLSDVTCAAVLGLLTAILVTYFFLRRREKETKTA